MKKYLAILFASLLLGVGTAFAQHEIVVGDMNDDGHLSASDITALTDAVLQPQRQRVATTKCDPDASEPAAVAGQWRAVNGVSLTLTDSGAASYSLDDTVNSFEYYPFRGIIVLLNEGGYVVRYFQVVRRTSDYLAIGNADGTCTAYYPADRFAGEFVISATSLSLRTGETQRLSVLASPEGGIVHNSWTWTSSNPCVASVRADGLVTALGGGTCTITATAQDGSGVSVSCSVSVVQLVTSITLSESALTLDVNQTHLLSAIVAPEDAFDASITWESSDETVAKVSRSGYVNAVGYGTAIITASAQDGSGVKAECQVTVKDLVPKPLTFTVNDVSFKMLPVEHGTFQMGQSADGNNVTPVHNVTISKDYWIGETEVTQALWYAVMGQTPTSSGDKWEAGYGLGDTYPAYNISWNDCQEFITKLNLLTGQAFRLPTEAEWEFAAKGGKESQGYTYSGSNNVVDVAWYTVNTYDKGSSSADYGIHSVATMQPNELGLYDMSGNVYEWCSDWYGSYSQTDATDPTGATSGTGRVTRGGSWYSFAVKCRTAYRGGVAPTHRSHEIGARLALTPSK